MKIPVFACTPNLKTAKVGIKQVLGIEAGLPKEAEWFAFRNIMGRDTLDALNLRPSKGVVLPAQLIKKSSSFTTHNGEQTAGSQKKTDQLSENEQNSERQQLHSKKCEVKGNLTHGIFQS